MSEKSVLRMAGQTHPGQIRDHNEDFLKLDEKAGIALLADGMGGLNAGEVASAMAVHMLMETLQAYVSSDKTKLQARIGMDSGEPDGVLQTAIAQVNRAVFHVSQTQPECQGMGTTLVASLFTDNQLTVGHIGDSRLYRFRDQQLEQLTKDHSYVQEMVDRGVFTPEQARASSSKNVVTRALGIGETTAIEVGGYQTEAGDLYLLCSDGLTDLVVDESIARILAERPHDLDGTAQRLVAQANLNGGRDNISVILVSLDAPETFPARLRARLRRWLGKS